MAQTDFDTHEVSNQSPVFGGVNLFLADKPLQDAVAREGAPQAGGRLIAFGAATGSAEGFAIGRLANDNPPKLRRFDEKGFPLDRVEFHPSYHQAMGMSIAEGLHCSAWDHLAGGGRPAAGAHVARLAGLYMMAQMEAGHVCPLSMTNAAVATLLKQGDVATPLIPKILSRTYDAGFVPIAAKKGITLGMGMTEKQGGSDVRANRTTAAPAGGGDYRLVGHKWFLSAPMCDGFLMLAQAPGGLSCFFVPRVLADGSTNALRLQRLKDKLGNRSNASCEVELTGAHARLVGEEGRGVATIIDMVTLTRLDCAVASAGQMRLALALAIHHCRHRLVFQKALIDQPLMTQVLADMALDVEAATALVFRLARAFDQMDDAKAAAWRRLMTPVMKYWVCKSAPALGYEAMECLGGNGYVEEGLAARLYRELPLNAIWEGSGNVMCLDVLRVVEHAAESVAMVLDQIEAAAGDDHDIRSGVSSLRDSINAGVQPAQARGLVESLALTAAAALLRGHAPTVIADQFIAGRLRSNARNLYGAGPAIAGAHAILARALPGD
jgi:putative acyl-CoA dehydrogenase